MGRKTKTPRPSRADRAAEQADFKTWLADAVAELQREHNINPSIIPIRVWRHLYIQGRSPQDGAAQAAMSASNTQSARDRLGGRKR
jgi:transposase-like protein